MPKNPTILTMTLHRRACIQALLASTLPSASLGVRAQSKGAEVVNETWRDGARARNIPVKIRWPAASLSPSERPVVIFSHGLGGTVEGGAIWGEAWAAAGFAVLHLQHPGSDLDAARAVATSFADQSALRTLAGAPQLIARLADVSFALDEIERRHAVKQGHWANVRPNQVGMSGHSFGARTAMGMAGQRSPGFDDMNEPRLASFIAFSTAVPAMGDAAHAYERVTRPVMSVTDSLDGDVVGTGATPARRKGVFAALPKGVGKGPKAHLVLKDADHMTFAGQTGSAAEILPREAVTRGLQAAHHALIARITTDWWLATLTNHAPARLRLQQPAGLQTGDLWELG